MTTNVVLIPGLNNTAETWSQVQQYLPADWNVQAVDIPPISDIDEIANQLLEGMQEPVYLCGFSFGGYVALAMLEKAPELIKGFILLGSNTTADSEQQKIVRNKAIGRAENGEYFEMMEANGPLTFHPNSLKNKEMMRTRRKIVNDYGPKRFIAHVKATMGRRDRTLIFKEAAIPKLVVAGKEDGVVPAGQLQELAASASNTEFKMIVDTGHMMPLEQPVAVAEVLQNWIERQ
ncbi:alpha/beta fold hydrolase [Sporosarcina obsidiansis]|uniref:alpha/beta fold hydrolase n=1 Tax=Sporosarcina obsidiansis TaxID=2660748 RepID=UPI00129AA477|nr:alpha/beta hydrolase [Sporosarcina obsidiansis]